MHIERAEIDFGRELLLGTLTMRKDALDATKLQSI